VSVNVNVNVKRTSSSRELMTSDDL